MRTSGLDAVKLYKGVWPFDDIETIVCVYPGFWQPYTTWKKGYIYSLDRSMFEYLSEQYGYS